jgi:uncharacterized protein (UPF0333 family)
MGRRGQVSLEFLFVFAIMLILLVYSVQNTTFSRGSSSVETLKIQVALESKNVANVISTTISQVYSQGPGAKATSYIHLNYLRDPGMLEKATEVKNPEIFITYGNYGGKGNGTYISVVGTGYQIYLTGPNKNTFWSRSLYQKILYDKPNAWSPSSSITVNSTTVYGLKIDPLELPAVLKVVVEWNPDRPDLWVFNSTSGELRININPGG